MVGLVLENGFGVRQGLLRVTTVEIAVASTGGAFEQGWVGGGGGR